MVDVESTIPLPRWAKISRTVFRVVIGVWSAGLVIKFIIGVIRKVTDHGNLFPAGDGWTTSDLVFLALIVIPALVSGLVWLAGEVIRGSREPI